MKIIVLMGSPRKQDSFSVCKVIEDKINTIHKTEFEYIYLRSMNIEDCKGCDQCFKKGELYCPLKDDIQQIREKLISADGIIFVSPVYAYQVTSSFKRLVDRLAFMFHRPELIGKPAITLTTTGGSGQKQVTKFLKMTACGWGCNVTGSLAVASSFYSKENNPYFSQHYFDSKNKEINKQAVTLISAMIEKKPSVPGYYDVYMFHGLKSKTYMSVVDYNYWESKGWLSSKYYYKTKLSLGKRIFGKTLDLIINAMWKKYQNASISNAKITGKT